MQIQLRNTILIGDAEARLAMLPDASVDCVVTSPPFFQLRDYGVAGQIGLEPSVDAWVDALDRVFAQVARVLRPGGAAWLDLADGYVQASRFGQLKSLVMGPERLLLRLAQRGWILRNRVVWAKTAPMPSGVADRLETTYDTVNLLVRSRRYFFDLDAIRERAVDESGEYLARNPGDVWQIEKARYRGAHFATFPERLVERPLLATCPAKLCLACGAPWRTVTDKEYVGRRVTFPRDPYVKRHPARYRVVRRRPRLVSGCVCRSGTQPGLVLDPFFGTGTVGAVAERLGRDWLGIELNRDYAQGAWKRIRSIPIRRTG